MNYKVIALCVTSAALGAGAMYLAIKEFYERRFQTELASIKEAFYKNEDEPDSEPKKKDIPEEKKRYEEFSSLKIDRNAQALIKSQKISEELKYTSPIERDLNGKKPYVIDSEEYGEDPTFNTMALTYYADGVLADEGFEPVTDIDDVVGKGTLSKFFTDEVDAIYVRDERRLMEYEIVLSLEDYADVINTRPPRINIT